MGNRNVVEISNLTKDIKGTKVLNKVNLQLESGKAYGIVGRNGSGKSMLFKAICGLINTTEGSITVFDKVIKNGSFPDNVGMIIENPGFLLQYSAFKNLKILASINNKISDERIKETEKVYYGKKYMIHTFGFFYQNHDFIYTLISCGM